MPKRSRILGLIEDASKVIAPLWSLKHFIAVNPCQGLEDQDFEAVIQRLAQDYHIHAVPDDVMLNQAIDKGYLSFFDREDLKKVKCQKSACKISDFDEVDAVFCDHLARHLDQEVAKWKILNDTPFYTAWRLQARYDRQFCSDRLSQLPASSYKLLDYLLQGYQDHYIRKIFEYHLIRLRGWAGYIQWLNKYRNQYDITLVDFLAVRLGMEWVIHQAIKVPPKQNPPSIETGLKYLKRWEQEYQNSVCQQIDFTQLNQAPSTSRPTSQWIFCIDVRSERYRRHIESIGHHHTYGFAGFFGLPIRYVNDESCTDACPVLLKPKYRLINQVSYAETRQAMASLQKTKFEVVGQLPHIELAGLAHGIGLGLRTWLPQKIKTLQMKLQSSFKTTNKIRYSLERTPQQGMTLKEKVYHAHLLLEMIGLKKDFAPWVVICGHHATVENNPYSSALQCGACGGNHGEYNARVMADILNETEVRQSLLSLGIDIPQDTQFVGALHNTTTDEISFFGELCEDKAFAPLQSDAQVATLNTQAERQLNLAHGKVTDRAVDWSQVRPEWGLANNACLFISERRLTQHINLDGRSFLHSYDWQADSSNVVLKNILAAPMVVAQWINNQYYFSQVNQSHFGAQSKVTHNIVGHFGVMQGNSSDLMNGLPWQSLRLSSDDIYHQPLRLSVFIQAPLAKVKVAIEQVEIAKTLIHNRWVYALVVDPIDKVIYAYQDGEWQIVTIGERG